MYYACIFALLTLFSFCELFGIRTIRKKAFYGISFLLLMLTAGLRYETGGDWTSYTSIFESIEPIDEVLTGQATAIDTLPIEIGYKYLNSIVRFFLRQCSTAILYRCSMYFNPDFQNIPHICPITTIKCNGLFWHFVLFIGYDCYPSRHGRSSIVLRISIH